MKKEKKKKKKTTRISKKKNGENKEKYIIINACGTIYTILLFRYLYFYSENNI